jgi:hypothetical protein
MDSLMEKCVVAQKPKSQRRASKKLPVMSGKLTVRIFGLLAAEAEGPIAIGALILIVFLAMTAAIVAKLFAV